jgi:hypothetical protein
MHGFEMERLAVELRWRNLTVALKFPGEHGREMLDISESFALRGLMFFAKMSAA